jgi:hypothetical protein
MKKLLLVVFAGWAAGVMAQERPEQFKHSARISGAGGDSHYRFTLPADAYRGVTSPDLGELRVFNGAGERVPYAFVPHRPAAQEPAFQATKLFPLLGEEAKGMDALNVRIRHTSGGGTAVDVSSTPGAKGAPRKLLGYVVDPGDLKKAPLEALVLDWRSREGFTGWAQVEASEDLKSWRTLASGASILLLEHAGQRLERRRIELGGQQGRYLRVSFSGVPADFALNAARLELRPDKAEPAREWLALPGRPDAAKPGEYEFDSGGHFPADRLRFVLPQVNTVAQVEIFSRNRAEDAWRAATSGTVYRLRRDGIEVTSAELRVAPSSSRYWLLRVDQRGGGLGAGEVRLEIGWVPHQVVFAARGAEPFSLAYGMKRAKPGALPITSVLPDYKEGEAISLKTVSLSALAAPAPGASAGFSEYIRDAVDSGRAKRWALWGALALGVLLLLWMAFALLQQVGKPK